MQKPKLSLSDAILCKYHYIKGTIDISHPVKNWWTIILFKMGIKKKAVFKLRYGRSFTIENESDYKKFFESADYHVSYLTDLGWRVTIGAKVATISKDKYKIKLPYKNKKELFEILGIYNLNLAQEETNGMDVKNKIVLDIGSNYADTAIYFIFHGAKRVYGYDMNKEYCEAGNRIVRANNMGNKIKLFNKKIGKKTNLCNIIKDLGLEDAVLKIDTDGHEREIIFNTKKEALRRFSEMIVEYSSGYRDLEDYIKAAGFKTRHTIPNMRYGEAIGLIYAKRIDR
jgi:hypothetical protein